MTSEKRTSLIEHLKYSRSIGADYIITDEDADEIIKALEQEPKTGHWMIVESIDRFFATYECSCCKRAIIVPHDAMKVVYKDYPYCHCGAKMQEVKNEYRN